MYGNTINIKYKSANMLRSSFYVCPVCGNVITPTGNALVSCCGVTLSPLEAEEGEAEDGILIKRIENEHFVQIENPMTKEHYISFVSYVTSDRVQTVKLYPETDSSCRFPVCGRGYIFYYCNRHGLMKFRVYSSTKRRRRGLCQPIKQELLKPYQRAFLFLKR